MKKILDKILPMPAGYILLEIKNNKMLLGKRENNENKK